MITVQDRPKRANVIFAPEYIPLCPVHNCDMISYSRRQTIVYYRCAIKTCECSDKVTRKVFVVAPTRPHPDAGLGK